MKIAILGNGGIAPVYKEALFDHDVITIDVRPGADYIIKDLEQEIKDIKGFDVGIVTLPNYLHAAGAMYFANDHGIKNIIVEKPGVRSTAEWKKLKEVIPNLHMVKNNLFRTRMKNFADHIMLQQQDVRCIKISWLEKDRIPNPGSWFTTKRFAFGGVSRDLMPHLFCMMYLFSQTLNLEILFSNVEQRIELQNVKSTHYGKINYDGILDVDTYAKFETEIAGIHYILETSWDHDAPKKQIEVIFIDGETKIFNFDLCPVEAYRDMVLFYSNAAPISKPKYNQLLREHQYLDERIHEAINIMQTIGYYVKTN